MQERNRESSKRNRNSRIESRTSSKNNNRKLKSKELTPVEKRNQWIEKNKKKSQRADNREKHSAFKKNRPLKNDQKPKVSPKRIKKLGKGRSLKASSANQKDKSDRSSVRKTGILISSKDFRQSKFAFFGFGLVFAYLLLLLSSVDTVISEGLFFIYLGVLLLKRPRIQSQGMFIDILAIGMIAYSLTASLPSMPFFFSDWRTSALIQYDLNFGFMRTIMPLRSLEAWLLLVASMIFYYHISSWKINSQGKEVLLMLLIGVSTLAGSIQYFTGNDSLGFLFSQNYERSPIKHYTDNLNVLYLLGGLGSVALFFDSVKSNKLVSVIGFGGALLNLFFLIYNESFFYYALFYGLSFLLIIRLYLRKKQTIEKSLALILLSSCFVAFLYFNQEWWSIFVQDIGGFFFAKGKQLWGLLFGSFKQLNIFGYGIGTAHSILPQLSPLEYYKDNFSYRGTYLISYISDFGFIGLATLVLFFCYSVFQYFRISKRSKMRHLFFYILVVLVFFLRFVMFSDGTSVGILFLLLIFLNLSLRIEKKPMLIFSKKSCQLLGVFWLCLGMFWVTVSITNMPLLSDIRYRLSYADQYDENVDFKALSAKDIAKKDALISKSNRNKYFLKAYQLLESKADAQEVVKTLYKAAFFDRNNTRVFLHLGYLLSDYDLYLANKVWNAYFELSPPAKFDDFRSLIYYSKDKYEVFLSLENLSYLSNEYAVEFALLLNDLDFQKYIEANSLNRFTVSNKNSQFQFLKRLLEEGFFDEYSEYVTKHENDIANKIILKAIHQKELANFEQALSILKNHILPERINIYQLNEEKKYLPRVFMQNYPDVEMGAVLIKNEIDEKNYESALIYVDHILSMNNPPEYAYYWRAELLYRMKDYVDSWFAFMTYLEKVNFQPLSK